MIPHYDEKDTKPRPLATEFISVAEGILHYERSSGKHLLPTEFISVAEVIFAT